jgi:methionine biosynthesis protein MetW
MDQLKQPFYGGQIDPNDENDPRTRIVNQIAVGSHVLEVGCGSGTIIRYLQHHKGCRTIGVEPSPQMAAAARHDQLIIYEGDINSQATMTALKEHPPFDYIIFADVLEHLKDPWETVHLVTPLLKPAGRILVSIPNVAFWRLRLNLLFGRWRYTEGHLMDHTHLRWFTRQTIQELFLTSGYRVIEVQNRWVPLPGHRLWQRIPGHQKIYKRLVDRWPGLFTYQFVVTAELKLENKR